MTEMQVMKEVRKLFHIRETKDEFLGTFSTTRISPFFAETSFLDTNLTYIDFLAIKDLPEEDLRQIANLPRLNRMESDSIVKLVFGDEADGTLNETINEIDHRLINLNRSTYMDYVSSGMSAETVAKKFITPKRKEIISEADKILTQKVVQEAKKRGVVSCSLADNINDKGIHSYYLLCTIETAAEEVDYSSFQLFAILPSGERLSFDGVQLPNVNLVSPSKKRAGDMNLVNEMVQEIEKKYGVYISIWTSRKYNQFCFSEDVAIDLTEEQVKQLLVPGTKLNMRFNGYDIRCSFDEKVVFYTRAMAFLQGDSSQLEYLSTYFQDIQNKERQEAEEKERREQEEKERQKKAAEKEKKEKGLKQREKKIKEIDFLKEDLLEKVISAPREIPQIRALDKFCEENSINSTVLTYIDKLPERFNKDAVIAGVKEYREFSEVMEKKEKQAIIYNACLDIGLGLLYIVLGWGWFWTVLFIGFGIYAYWKKTPGLFKFMIKEVSLPGEAGKLYKDLLKKQKSV